MAGRPFGIDGLLGDEAMAATLRVLMHLVHLALIDSVLLVVVVRSNAVIGSTGKDGVRGY